jgi:hypothetical protein
VRPRIPATFIQEGRNLGAVTRAIVFAGFLWWLTWLQIVLQLFYGPPYLSDPAFALGFYEQAEGYPFNVPQFLLILSISASVIAFLGVWTSSGGTAGKWRQRLLVLFFALVCCAIAYLPFVFESMFLDSARVERAFIMDHPSMVYPDDIPYEIISQEWIHLDEAIEKAEQRMKR